MFSYKLALDFKTEYDSSNRIIQIVPCKTALRILLEGSSCISLNIFICFKYYTVEVFYMQIWFKCEIPLLFFQIKTMVYRKKLLTEKNRFFCRLYKNYWITCCTHMMSHATRVDEITRIMISIKEVNKN